MLPKTVNICGVPYHVFECADIFNSDTTHLGQIDFVGAIININAMASKEIQMQTLFHEMLHGMLVAIGRTKESEDEQLVTALSMAMYQSFRLKEEE